MIRSIGRFVKTISSPPIWPIVVLLTTTSIVQVAVAPAPSQTDQTAVAMSRDYYLSDLIQSHRYAPGKNSFQWAGLDAPWKVLGPIAPETPLPSTVSDQSYETTVAINKPTQLVERWQNTQMLSGFLDLTYQFRHYALIESGSGFVAGASKTKLMTYIYSDSDRTVEAILGHDDGVLVQANGVILLNLPGNPGFGPSSLRIPLRTGWNTLDLVLSNNENTDWRWSGLSLALSGQNQNQALRFSAELPSSSFVLVSTKEH